MSPTKSKCPWLSLDLLLLSSQVHYYFIKNLAFFFDFVLNLLFCSAIFLVLISTVISQKSESEVTRKQIMANFPKNEHFLTPDAHAYKCVSGGGRRGRVRNVRFSEIWFKICPIPLSPTIHPKQHNFLKANETSFCP